MKLRAALGFFTRLPVGSTPSASSFEGVMVWLPVVGVIIGLLMALVLAAAALCLPAPLCGVLACLAWVAMTGGLHLDGVADCGDGLIVETSPARRLEIMKDSRLGTFGGIALFFVLALKATALYTLALSLTASWGALLALAGACCLAGGLARSLVFVAMRLPSARPEGLGAALRRGIAARHEWTALAIGLGLCMLNGLRGLAALALSALVVWLLLAAARKRLGGVTGDVFGCLIELVECSVLIVCCLL